MVDLHAGEMEESARHRVTPKGAATPCRANEERSTCCKYGRRPRFRKHGHCSASEYEMNRNISSREYQRSSHEYFTLTNSRRREDSHKSKFRRRGMPSNLIFLLLVSFLLVCEAKNSVKGTPPRLIGEAKRKITATVGETVALKCMVEAEPPPLASWSFNGKPILGVKRRFKADFHLRIREVRTTDSGRYRCTATNAFGSVDYNINLVVRDLEGKIPPTKPRFVMPAKMRRREFSKPVNSFLRLRCRASGHPRPEIEWYKNGNLTHPPGLKSGRRQAWIYTIRKLQQNDSGQYRCRVWNNQGEINYAYGVRVVEQLRERPVLLDPHPKNTTVHVGGTTAIQCRVQSRVEPTVKWIKRLDDKAIAAYRGVLPQNVITIEKHHYLILPTQDMLSMANGSYLNKLVIRGVTEKHGGMYICMAANTMGYNYKYAYLTVVSGPINASRGAGSSPGFKLLPRSGSQNKQGRLSVPAIIGIPAGIGLVMVVFLAWFCHRRREQRFKSEAGNVVVSGLDRLSALDSSETKPSTFSTPLPQDCEFRAEDNNNKDSSHPLVGAAERQTNRNHENYYSYNYRPPPTAGTPLLTVNEPDESEFEIASTDNDGYYDIPIAPPCSEVASSCRSDTEKRLTFSLGPPPPPPPSQKSASSLSSYPDMRAQYSHHYHYMHPSGNSRRHHHHHSRNGIILMGRPTKKGPRGVHSSPTT